MRWGTLSVPKNIANVLVPAAPIRSRRCFSSSNVTSEYHQEARNGRLLGVAAAMALAGFIVAVAFAKEKSDPPPDGETFEDEFDAQNYKIPPRPDLPNFTIDEIERHKDRNTGVWVTFQHGVYDISEWIDIHPGGISKIMLAAGAL